MQSRWFLTQFYQDDELNMLVPVCTAYGGRYLCPTHPDFPDGWALVQMLCDAHQLEAAAQDPRVIVLPLTFDPASLPAQVIDAYATWGATAGMSLGALLAKLAAAEPTFASTL